MTIEEHNNLLRATISDLKDAVSGKWEITQGTHDTDNGFRGMIKDLKKCIIKDVILKK